LIADTGGKNMVRMNKEWPEEGDLIVGTVHKVLGYGAFALLFIYQRYPQVGLKI
jgi:translation initiation factor 2 alpha subunit (eIF-2alpha)